MPRQIRTLIAVLTTGLFAACGMPASRPTDANMTGTSGKATVGGVATYRERIALPGGAVFEATIEDVSQAGAPSGPELTGARSRLIGGGARTRPASAGDLQGHAALRG